MKQDILSQLMDEEASVATIDDVITLLFHAHDSFHLGNTNLNEEQKFDLIAQHEDLGCILRIAINELRSVSKEFEETHLEIIKSIKADVAERLVAARGNKTIEEVCQATGISEEALTAYETDHRVPRDEVKVKLAEYYGKSIKELFF